MRDIAQASKLTSRGIKLYKQEIPRSWQHMRSAGPGSGVELPLIAGIVKRLVHRYRYADRVVFQRRWLRQTGHGSEYQRFIFVPTDE